VGNRQVVQSYAQALSADDFDTQDSLIHDDYVLDYPQSGERIRGRPNRRAIVENYPNRIEAGTTPSMGRIIGMDDEFIPRATGPSWGVLHLAGSGDDFQMTGTIRYPDGNTWHIVALLTLRNGKIWRETDYFGPPFEPPAWRSQYVEIDEERRTSGSA
jgi:ketosteroid isomerase-like protein